MVLIGHGFNSRRLHFIFMNKLLQNFNLLSELLTYSPFFSTLIQTHVNSLLIVNDPTMSELTTEQSELLKKIMFNMYLCGEITICQKNGQFLFIPPTNIAVVKKTIYLIPDRTLLQLIELKQYEDAGINEEHAKIIKTEGRIALKSLGYKIFRLDNKVPYLANILDILIELYKVQETYSTRCSSAQVANTVYVRKKLENEIFNYFISGNIEESEISEEYLNLLYSNMFNKIFPFYYELTNIQIKPIDLSIKKIIDYFIELRSALL